MTKKRGICIYSVIFFGLFFFSLTGRQLAAEGNILWTPVYVVKLLLLSVAGGILCGFLCAEVLLFVDGKIQKSVTEESRLHPVRTFLLSWAGLTAAWLPAWLAYYPGICSYDITIQMGQIVSGEYIDHHPLAHTLLVRWFLHIGGLLGDVNTGMGLYTLFQLLFLAGTMAFGIAVLYRASTGRGFLWVLQLYGMFFPFHWYMSISATKDTIFTCFVLLLLIALYQTLMSGRNNLAPGRWDLLYAISLIGVILFRNNGRYAFLVVLGVLLLCLLFARQRKKLYGRLFLWGLAGFLLGSLALTGLSRATGATQGDKREMLSMPIQQLARTMLYHGGVGELPEDDGTMEETDRALINDFLLDEAYRAYRPEIADPVKTHTLTAVVRYRTGEFLKTYFHLLVQYPGDYINAALAVDAGYLYPYDVSHASTNFNGRDRGLGYVQTRWVENELNPWGIYKASKWESLHEWLEEFADSNAYLKLPLLKYLFMPGWYLWFYLLFAGFLWWKKRYWLLLPLAFVLGYYMTLLLGPTVQLRYLYPVMIALPYGLLFCPRGKRVAAESRTGLEYVGE